MEDFSARQQLPFFGWLVEWGFFLPFPINDIRLDDIIDRNQSEGLALSEFQRCWCESFDQFPFINAVHRNPVSVARVRMEMNEKLPLTIPEFRASGCSVMVDLISPLVGKARIWPSSSWHQFCFENFGFWFQTIQLPSGTWKAVSTIYVNSMARTCSKNLALDIFAIITFVRDWLLKHIGPDEVTMEN